MEKLWRVCNVGCCAGIAQHHLNGYLKSKRAKIVAVCDINEEGRKIAERCNVKFYKNFDEMIEKENFEILDVCSPDNFHYYHTISAVKKGIHVLCEKPLVMNLKEADEIEKEAKKNNVFVMPSMMMRWINIYEKTKEIIKSGKIGRPVFGRYIYKGSFYPYPEGSFYRKKESLGQFFHNGIHYLDLMCYLLESLPISVFTNTTEYFEKDKLETPNYYIASYRMENKSILETEYNQLLRWQKYIETEIYIIGTKGNICISNENVSVKVSSISGEFYPFYTAYTPEYNPFFKMINHFIDVLENKTKPLISIEEANRIIKATILTVKSGEIGKSIDLK